MHNSFSLFPFLGQTGGNIQDTTMKSAIALKRPLWFLQEYPSFCVPWWDNSKMCPTDPPVGLSPRYPLSPAHSHILMASCPPNLTLSFTECPVVSLHTNSWCKLGYGPSLQIKANIHQALDCARHHDTQMTSPLSIFSSVKWGQRHYFSGPREERMGNGPRIGLDIASHKAMLLFPTRLTCLYCYWASKLHLQVGKNQQNWGNYRGEKKNDEKIEKFFMKPL